MTEYDNALLRARNRGILLAAHRGSVAGNIPFNTLASYEAAIFQGAQIVEVDVTRSVDGELFTFHPTMEKNHLNKDIHLEKMSAYEIKKERYVNIDNTPTNYPIPTLDEALDLLKGRCFINLDHCWDYIPDVIAAVRRHHIEGQIIFKTPASLKYARQVEDLAPDIMYMPIFEQKDDLTAVLEKMNLNYAAAEIVFAKDSASVAQPDYVKRHHDKRRLLWVNSLLYYYDTQLSGGHNDDISVTGHPEEGWGWLIDRGFDIIQTDWLQTLASFIAQRDKNGS